MGYDPNTSAPFFDPDWMFGVAQGFDIVIGNPPYVQLQGRDADLYQGCGFQTFERTGDMYCLFYERGHQLLRPGGHLCYISSNKWMRAGYGRSLRNFFAQHTDPQLLIDFAGVRIFEGATVDTNILLFARAKNQQHTRCATANPQNQADIKANIAQFVNTNSALHAFTSSDSWVMLSPIQESIRRKIEAKGTPLKDWDIQIYRGILTGCNEAFIISTAQRDAILDQCTTDDERRRTQELIRPILRGKDIKRYGYKWAGKWLIATHNGIRGKMDRIHIEDYPAVKAHLDRYWDKISVRDDQGATPYNLRNCAYWQDFGKPKIIYMEIQTDNPEDGYPFPCYSYDATNKVVLNTAYIMSSTTVDVKYLLGVLNSKLGNFLVKLYVTQLQQRQHRMLAQYVSKFPIPNINNKQKEELIHLVSKQIEKPCIQYESEIDRVVYSIFCLTSEEIKFIENNYH